MGNPYQERNKILEGMGYATYAEYLGSDLWKSIRKRFFTSEKRKCCRCQGKATQIHHSHYTVENLSGRSLERLHAICWTCHDWAEHDGDTKVSLHRANDKLGLPTDPLSMDKKRGGEYHRITAEAEEIGRRLALGIPPPVQTKPLTRKERKAIERQKAGLPERRKKKKKAPPVEPTPKKSNKPKVYRNCIKCDKPVLKHGAQACAGCMRRHVYGH